MCLSLCTLIFDKSVLERQNSNTIACSASNVFLKTSVLNVILVKEIQIRVESSTPHALYPFHNPYVYYGIILIFVQSDQQFLIQTTTHFSQSKIQYFKFKSTHVCLVNRIYDKGNFFSDAWQVTLVVVDIFNISRNLLFRTTKIEK